MLIKIQATRFTLQITRNTEEPYAFGLKLWRVACSLLYNQMYGKIVQIDASPWLPG